MTRAAGLLRSVLVRRAAQQSNRGKLSVIPGLLDSSALTYFADVARLQMYLLCCQYGYKLTTLMAEYSYPSEATGPRPRSALPARARVAIVGGGCAGLATAFELSGPEHQGRYEITLYQMGFRLGGKGASGRGVGGRIEEHGLHLWMGFYENAFRMMRECYAELGRDAFRCPISTWQDAFKPAPWVAVTDKAADGTWQSWLAEFPAARGLPGDPLDESNPFTISAYLSHAVKLVIALLRSAEASSSSERQGQAAPVLDETQRASPEKLVSAIEWVVRHGQLATAAGLVYAAQLLQAALDWSQLSTSNHLVPLHKLIDAIAHAARRQLAMLVSSDASLRRTFTVVDLVLAIIRGSIVHGLAWHPEGFDAIDDYEWRQWLKQHGAAAESLDSGFMRGFYDLAFAYEAGDPQRPALSAAAALRGAMRMFFTYRGSLFWRMTAGMGDCVFAPLYEVLKRRGVRFEFFHRLSDVQVAQAHVTALCFDVQAELRSVGEYQPLVSVQRLPCWPSEPDYEQLVNGAQLRSAGVLFESPWEARVAGQRVLHVGKDFDFVVLALGGGAMPTLSQELLAASPKWRSMAEGMHTVATQAFQIWLTRDMTTLGWRGPAVNLSGWVEPFDTWADMTHLIPAESSELPVQAIAYFCSPLPDLPRPDDLIAEKLHTEQRARVRASAVRLLDHEIAALWPAAVSGGCFRWDLLAVEPAAPEALRSATGAQRFDSQFWTANVRPTDRYTLSLPGGARQRLSPLDRSFDNLTVAGDWTESGLNTGCVESAVMSGRLAAHALSGAPALRDIVGYDHP